jgi:hypothetical protein
MPDTIEARQDAGGPRPPPTIPAEYRSEVDLEYARWSELVGLVRLLTPDERTVPGYFRDPDWTVKDLIAHLGAWLAEAATELTKVAARTYEPRDLDIDARNAATLAALREAPWDEVWDHATTSRATMLQHWFALRSPSDAADLWVRKAGAEHYGEHLPRLRAWVAQLIELRTRGPRDDWTPQPHSAREPT